MLRTRRRVSQRSVERDALLALMDANMLEAYRADARTSRDGFVVERDGLCMCGTPHGSPLSNMAIVTRPLDVRALRAGTSRVFGEAGLPFTVWTRAHADRALEAELRAAGWLELTRVPGMVYRDGDGEAPVRSPACVVREVVDEEGRAAYADVAAAAWSVYGNPPETTHAHFPTLASLRGVDRVAFVVRVDDVPVACAVLYLACGVGGIGWVGTVPAVHGRGYGAAVTWTVMHEGLRRGVAFLNLQASPMGEPLYRRLGFRTPTHYGVWIARDDPR